MSDSRKGFEALPEIKPHLDHGNVIFNEHQNNYASEFESLHFVACFVSGAWMAFQKQQKKIDAVKLKSDEIINVLNEKFKDISDQDKEIICDYIDEIKELLK